MAKGKKTGGGPLFGPGNQYGRPKVPEDIKEGRRLNKSELERIMTKLLNMEPDELKAHLAKRKMPCKEMLIGTIILKAIQGGDHYRTTFLLDRLIGKVKEQVEMTGMKLFTIEKKFGPDAGTKVLLGAQPIEVEGGEIEESENG